MVYTRDTTKLKAKAKPSYTSHGLRYHESGQKKENILYNYEFILTSTFMTAAV